MEFYDKDWNLIGEKQDMVSELRNITGIDTFVLQGGPLEQVSIARRMSWAAYRQTSREEDIAYSLLGISGVNMPLLYGEGARSFLRLQEEILKQSADQTLFAWRATESGADKAKPEGYLPTLQESIRTSWIEERTQTRSDGDQNTRKTI
jgi:hypothetical protein